MSWFNQFDASGFANLAKTALKEAQKTIDKALDIKEEDDDEAVEEEPDPSKDTENQDPLQKASKLSSSLWSSFTNSVFESQDDEVSDKQNEMRQSMSLDLSKSSVENDLIVANQPVRSSRQSPRTQDEQFKVIEIESESNSDVVRRVRRASFNNNNRLSTVSCDSDRKSTISSDSIEVLGSASTSTPESSSIEVITSSSVEVLAVVTEPNRITDKEYSPETIEPIPELIEDDDSLTCSVSDNVTCMANEDTLIPNYGGISMLKSTASSLDTSFTELSSPHEISGVLDVLKEKSIELNSNKNCVVLQKQLKETVDELKNVQDDLTTITTLNTNSSSNDLLKVSDTTLKSSSCDDDTMVISTVDQTNVDEEREQSPQTSTDNHSDFVKIGSSETNSCDELETWTSSDIEVISSPATNEDSESNASHRHSPVKYHPYNNLPPYLSGQHIGPKDSEDLQKKIVELNFTIKARESKLIDLSKKNAELAAINSEMKSQLDYLNSSHLNEEYTQRLAAMEKKFQQAIREKDQLQKQLDQNKNAAQFKVLIDDKDSLIKELRDEGEKLSKQHLNLNNIIKRLRVAEKDSTKTINKYKEQQEKLSQEVERIKKSLVAKEEMERSQIEAIHQLTKSNQTLEKENLSLLGQVENLTSTLVSLQKNIQEKENTVLELQKKSDELKFAEKDKLELEEKLSNKNKQCEEMKLVISNLKANLCKVEENNHVLMNELKQENLLLIRRLEESERKRENSLQETLKATQPLVKELEEKSAILKTFELDFEKREQLHLKTIDKLQTSLNSAEHKIKLLDSKIQESNTIGKKHREQVDNLLQNENDLKCEVDNLKEENATLKLNTNSLVKLENELAGSKKLLADATYKINTLENELKLEKDKLNIEIEKRKKLQNDIHSQQLSTSHQSSPTTSVGVPSVEESSFWPSFADDDRSSVTERAGSIYDPMRTSFSNTTSVLENLQSQIKLKEGEALQLQWELSRRDHERDQLTTELAALTTKVEEQSLSLAELSDLQKRYDALLQLYGEKLEESEELKLDLQDVKDMYKAQIDELLKRDKTG